MIVIMSNDFLERLIALGRRDLSLDAGRYLFHLGDPVEALFVVRAGTVQLVRHQEDGASLVLQRARPGEMLAEASFFSAFYHCDGVTATPSTVRVISKQRGQKLFREDPGFAEAWAAHLADEVQRARFRSEVLSRRTVTARLDAWLVWHDALPAGKGEWKQIAAQIGVSPEALYRELARRRQTRQVGAGDRNRYQMSACR